MNQKCMETINYIERCAFGVIKCPKRPLIIADWWYQVEPGMAMGEAIWLHEVVSSANISAFWRRGLLIGSPRILRWKSLSTACFLMRTTTISREQFGTSLANLIFPCELNGEVTTSFLGFRSYIAPGICI